MKNVKNIFEYECTVLRYALYFYIIQFIAIAVISLLDIMINCNIHGVRMSGIEFNTIIFIAICSQIAFKINYKFLLQNGFIRKEIFMAIIFMISIVSIFMALVDVFISRLLKFIINYKGIFEQLYNKTSFFNEFLFFMFVYLMIGCIFSFFAIIYNKLSKKVFFIIIFGIFAVIIATINFVINTLPKDIGLKIIKFFAAAFGFFENGINTYIPLLTFIFIIILFVPNMYYFVRKIELK